jgi:uncharacterized membrane protein YgdD (TMEM256/DUF423 family)
MAEVHYSPLLAVLTGLLEAGVPLDPGQKKSRDPVEVHMTYGVYYQLSLILTIFAGAAGMAALDDVLLRRHLANLQTGLLGFLFPALAVRILSPEPEGLLPSVMCHFAIALAASLYVLALRERQTVI